MELWNYYELPPLACSLSFLWLFSQCPHIPSYRLEDCRVHGAHLTEYSVHMVGFSESCSVFTVKSTGCLLLLTFSSASWRALAPAWFGDLWKGYMTRLCPSSFFLCSSHVHHSLLGNRWAMQRVCNEHLHFRFYLYFSSRADDREMVFSCFYLLIYFSFFLLLLFFFSFFFFWFFLGCLSLNIWQPHLVKYTC